MLPSASRMRSSTEFRDTMRRGTRTARPTLVLHARPLSAPPSRIGFVVSKAVGGAVERNRVKRRLRHMVRPLLSDATPVAVVVRALPPSRTDAGRLATDLTGAWQTMLQRLDRSARPAHPARPATSPGGVSASGQDPVSQDLVSQDLVRP